MALEQQDDGQGVPSAEDTGTAVGQEELAEQFGRLARVLQQENDIEKMLDELVRSAVTLIPGVNEGSISVVRARREVTSQSPTSDLPRRVDALQSEMNEGPCLDAAYDEQTVRVANMAEERRWPRFAPRAAEMGALSMLSFQLYVEGDNLGALNLYGYEANAFTDESEHVGLIFASHAAVAFADARKLDQLSNGLISRDLIGQAKGILMERYQLDAHQAFGVLTRISQNSNRKLHVVAAALVRDRQVAGLSRPPTPDGDAAPDSAA